MNYLCPYRYFVDSCTWRNGTHWAVINNIIL